MSGACSCIHSPADRNLNTRRRKVGHGPWTAHTSGLIVHWGTTTPGADKAPKFVTILVVSIL